MAAKEMPTLGPDRKILDKFLPTNLVTDAELAEALMTVGVTAGIEARIAQVEQTTERLWHTRVGGVLTGAPDPNGEYPVHPITDQPLLFTGKRPGSDGDRVTGTGRGMDIIHYPADSWAGPA